MAAPRKDGRGTGVDTLRRSLRRSLPPRVRATLAGYEAFAAGMPPDDPKGYAAHHAACKSALQHADMLIKLLGWAESADEKADAADPAALLARARAALATHDEEGEENDPPD